VLHHKSRTLLTKSLAFTSNNYWRAHGVDFRAYRVPVRKNLSCDLRLRPACSLSRYRHLKVSGKTRHYFHVSVETAIKLVLCFVPQVLSGGLTTTSTATHTLQNASAQASVPIVASISTRSIAPGTEEYFDVLSEKRFVDSINTERKNRQLVPLRINPLLVEVARRHSREMWEKNYFDHVSPSPDLRTPMDRYLKRLGRIPKWAFLGENLFYCSIADVDRGHHCLMQSPTHRQNILNPDFREIGVGCYLAPDGRFYVTQLFLTQVD